MTTTKRFENGKKIFVQVFGSQPEVVSQAPGRAEILGCHTDYNHGFALGAAISRSTLGFFRKRDDQTIRVSSTAYPGKPILFSIGHIEKDRHHHWTNYVRAVIGELIQAHYPVRGTDILIDSNVPKSGGVSSSAALELAVAYGMLSLHGQKIDAGMVATLCQKAENGPLVNSPCGFLDQGTATFAKNGSMVFLDFLPKGNTPVSNVKTIESKINMNAFSLVISVDRTLERQLGKSGYVQRRQMCQESLPFWADWLKKPITSLRDVTIEDFHKFRDILEEQDPIMRRRVEHVLYENERVLTAAEALTSGDAAAFGKLLTQSGESGLTLYGLDEGTPQLTFLVTYGRSLPGVMGIRNMGGGFSAISLALVEKPMMEPFQNDMRTAYGKKFNRPLEFIEFSPAQGAEVLHV